jgi:AAA+ superfamily predicted ATPase
MTQLISTAFEETVQEAAKLASASGQARGAVILLVDEADALAQSREASQMHHEDRAGVNALIRGIDRLANSRSPAAVIMCTNRLDALDPAVRRRAADVLLFDRPGDADREMLLVRSLEPLGFTRKQIENLVGATGPRSGRDYGFTFSDIVQRLLPNLVLDAYPDGGVEPSRAIEIARNIVPTRPFQEGAVR